MSRCVAGSRRRSRRQRKGKYRDEVVIAGVLQSVPRRGWNKYCVTLLEFEHSLVGVQSPGAGSDVHDLGSGVCDRLCLGRSWRNPDSTQAVLYFRSILTAQQETIGRLSCVVSVDVYVPARNVVSHQISLSGHGGASRGGMPLRLGVTQWSRVCVGKSWPWLCWRCSFMAASAFSGPSLRMASRTR